MYRVVCRLRDGSVFTQTAKEPFEPVSRFLVSYGVEITHLEANLIGEESNERQQVLKLGLADTLNGLYLSDE